MAVPYTFGSATSSIPLSQLDSNFATGITLGNTTVYLGNTTTSFGNVTLTNVTISSVSTAITPSQGGTGLVTIPANNVILGNGTSNVTVVAPGTSGNVLTSNGTTWTSSTISAASVSAAGSTTQVQYNNAGAFAGSANLTFNGTTLTAAGLSGPHDGTVGATTPNTGSFTTLAASSTVSGTGFSTYLASPPAIGSTAANTGAFTTLSASSTVTLSGGTANGVTYLNGSKVLTSGSALVFDGSQFKTSVSGNTPIVNETTGGTSNYLQLKNTGGSAYIGSVSNDLAFYYSGSATEGMRLTSTGLGIGTSSPATKLQVNNSANSGNTISVTGLTTATGAAELLATRTGTESASQGLSPSITLGNTSASRYSSISGYQGGFQFFGFDGSSWNERMRIDSSGNLGLGVTPSAWGRTAIQIGGAGSVAYFAATNIGVMTSNVYYDGSSNKYISSNPAVQYSQGSGQHSWSVAASGTAGNAITFTQAMTLDASGRLLIGSTTNTTNSNLILSGATRWAVGTQSGGNIFYIVRDSDNVGQYMVQGSTSWTATSDERLKDIIEPITNASSKVSTLRAVIGKFKKDAEGTRRSFLIAQDVQAVLPEAVTVQEDEFGTLGIQYTEVIPLLVAAIKEQNTVIESLKARLDAANL